MKKSKFDTIYEGVVANLKDKGERLRDKPFKTADEKLEFEDKLNKILKPSHFKRIYPKKLGKSEWNDIDKSFELYLEHKSGKPLKDLDDKFDRREMFVSFMELKHKIEDMKDVTEAVFKENFTISKTRPDVPGYTIFFK